MGAPVNAFMTTRLENGRTILLLNHPFFGAMIFRLKPVESRAIKTMATDGRSLFMNPEFVHNLTPEEYIFLLAHEVCHPLMGHHTRRGDREHELWNIACDYAINPILVDARLKMPKGMLLDSRFANMSAEQIYNVLLSDRDNGSSGGGQQQQEQSAVGGSSQQQPGSAGQQPQSSAGGPDTASSSDETADPNDPQNIDTPGGFGQVLDAPNEENPGAELSEGQRADEEASWAVAANKARHAAKGCGKMPGSLDRALTSAEEAQVEWTGRFRHAFAQTIPCDFSWTRPNRRFIHTGLYLPGVIRGGVGELAVAIDYSGSINARQLSKAQAEINSLITEHRPSAVHLIGFDTAILDYERVSEGETVELENKGGGGTSFEPVFEFIEEMGLNPHALIVLTDLDGSFPEAAPGYPVLWVSSGYSEAPFGETIRISAA